jgi:molybdate transport system substrate-binding protein
MAFSRRRLLAVSPAAVAAVVLTPEGAVDAATTDLAVSCDSAVASAVSAAGMAYRTRSGVRIRVFPTAPGLILPQIEREIQNDIIVTQIATIDQADKAGLLTQGGRAGPWRNRLVTAMAKEPSGPEGSFAVPDASPGSDIDGAVVLRRLGASPAKVLGVIDTGTVAWTLTAGGARQGLLHQTEVAADDRLQAVGSVPDDAWPPILYAAVVTKLTRRGDPAAFIAFLASPEGLAVLRSAGLEAAS